MTAFGVPETFFEEPEEADYDPSDVYIEETENEKKEKTKYYIG